MVQRFIYALTAILFASAIIAGAYIDVSDLIDRKPQFPIDRMTPDGIWNGINTQQVGSFLENESKLSRDIKAIYSERLFELTGAGHPSIIAGPDMLFFRDRTLPHDEAFWRRKSDDALRVFKEVDDLLQSWGGQLAVLIVPDRARAYNEKLPTDTVTGSPKGRYYSLLQQGLQKRGILSIDFMHLLKDWHDRNGKDELLFRRDDHHWNALGAKVAAEAVAQSIARHSMTSPLAGPLSIERVAVAHPGSLLRRSGWAEGSSLWKRYADVALRDTVRREDGATYAAPWKENTIVVADSFGHWYVGEQAAAILSSPVATIAQAGKGPFPPLARICEQLQQGWRPQLVIWMFEELATYGRGTQFRDWKLCDDLLSLKEGRTAIPIPLSTLRDSKVGQVTVEQNQLRIKTNRNVAEVRIPRSVIKSELFSFYVRTEQPSKGTPHLKVFDEHSRTSSASARYPLLNHDSKWHLATYRVPKGSGDLVIQVQASNTDPHFALRDLAYWVPADQLPRFTSESDRRPASYSATAAQPSAPVIWDIFGTSTHYMSGTDLVLEGIKARGWSASETSEYKLKPILPKQGTIKIALGAMLLPKAQLPQELSRLPLVASLYISSDSRPSPRLVHQVSFHLADSPTQLKLADIPLRKHPGEDWSLSVRLYVPTPLVGLAVAGFATPSPK